jgi:hypothetical protein
MTTYVHLRQYLSEVTLEWETSQIKVLEKINTRMLRLILFSENHSFFEITSKKVWYTRTGHILQYNTAHVLCMLDT